SHVRCWRYQFSVSRIASRCGVVSEPKAAAYLLWSTTNGCSDWYSTSFTARIVGLKSASTAMASCGLARERRSEDPVADGRLADIGSKKVGAASDGCPHLAHRMSFQQGRCQVRPCPPIGARRSVGQVFSQGNRYRAIHV